MPMNTNSRSIGSAPDLTCLGVGPEPEADILSSLPFEDDVEPETLHRHHNPETGEDVLCYVAAYVRKERGTHVWRYVAHTAEATYRLTEGEYDRWMEHTERLEATPLESSYVQHARAGQLDRLADHKGISPYSMAIRFIERNRDFVDALEPAMYTSGTATQIARGGRRVAM